MSHVVRNEIITNDARPICCGLCRLSPAGLRTEQECVQDMLDRGQFEPSDSPWTSPVVLVTKKDGSTHFCVDYRRLNVTIVKDVYLLFSIDDSLRLLGGASSGFPWMLSGKLFQFRVMPFGLCNGPCHDSKRDCIHVDCGKAGCV